MNNHPDFERSQCLIVAHSDGYIEAYGPKNLSAKMVRMPDCDPIVAEGVVEDLLPPRWRKWFFSGCLRGAMMNRPLKPATMVVGQEVLVLSEIALDARNNKGDSA